jgi:hypothetical protein
MLELEKYYSRRHKKTGKRKAKKRRILWAKVVIGN